MTVDGDFYQDLYYNDCISSHSDRDDEDYCDVADIKYDPRPPPKFSTGFTESDETSGDDMDSEEDNVADL